LEVTSQTSNINSPKSARKKILFQKYKNKNDDSLNDYEKNIIYCNELNNKIKDIQNRIKLAKRTLLISIQSDKTINVNKNKNKCNNKNNIINDNKESSPPPPQIGDLIIFTNNNNNNNNYKTNNALNENKKTYNNFDKSNSNKNNEMKNIKNALIKTQSNKNFVLNYKEKNKYNNNNNQNINTNTNKKSKQKKKSSLLSEYFTNYQKSDERYSFTYSKFIKLPIKKKNQIQKIKVKLIKQQKIL
jgi:hypothetical protein